jgi:hypothetical protein
VERRHKYIINLRELIEGVDGEEVRRVRKIFSKLEGHASIGQVTGSSALSSNPMEATNRAAKCGMKAPESPILRCELK